MPIRLLSEETINKIAAGEVVERPANVIKELVENSLDAESRCVDIEIKGAGRQLIRVRDDGGGMPADDMAVAVERHATSKIAAFDDLETLATFGFRGEALPSIAAVSRLLLQSKPRAAATGWEMRLEGGKITESRAWNGSPGTTVEVAHLFYHTPARAKFLKSDATERHRMLRTIEELALAWPAVSFTVISEGKKVLAAPAAKSLKERLLDVLGKEFTAGLIPLEVDHPGLALRAHITRREHSLAQRSSQFLFVNRRPVNWGKPLLHALYEAYREHLPAGRHPGAVVFLETDPAAIDVNIHPTKREVRFSKENEIRDLFYRSLRNAVSASSPVPFPFPSTGQGTAPHGGRSSQIAEPKPHYSPSAAGLLSLYGGKPASAPVHHGPAAPGEELPFRPLGQLFNLYLLVQKGDELLVIDQHAAAERVRYERYLDEWRRKRITVQPLLIPETLELPPSQAGLLKENLPLLKETGWDIEEFGTNTVRIAAVPAALGTQAGTKDVIARIVQALTDEIKPSDSEKTEKIIRAACRASVKAGDTLSFPEITALVRDLFNCVSPATCPHGRPALFRVSRAELEKHFGR